MATTRRTFSAAPLRPTTPVWLPRQLRALLEAEAHRFFYDGGCARTDFTTPPGEPSFALPNSVSWQIFKNPLTLFIGGVTAVLLELAEPRVRTGIWEHTRFRIDPVRRLRRTGLAAMITVYGPKSRAEAMIARISHMHGRVEGRTPCGQPYTASDPELLRWVAATAAFGFIDAYRRFAAPIDPEAVSRYYAEGETAALLYGAHRTPRSEMELWALFGRMEPLLQPSPIVFEFLRIMRVTPILPRGARVLQGMLIRAGVDGLPGPVRQRLGLGPAWSLRRWEHNLIAAGARLANATPLGDTPPVLGCVRLGLPPDFLFRGR